MNIKEEIKKLEDKISSENQFKVHNVSIFEKELENLLREIGVKQISNFHGNIGFKLSNPKDISKVKDFLKEKDKNKNSYIQQGSSLSNIIWDSKKASDSTLKQIAEAVKGHNLMSMRKPLEGIFKKKDIDFSFEPIPAFHIKHKGKTIIIVNKNNVEDIDSSDMVVGDVVIGYL